MSPVRIGLVGAGGIAQAYAQLLAADSPVPTGATGVGVTDVNPAAATAWADRVGCPTFPDVESLVASGPDAVVICTPPATHRAVAGLCSAAGIPVLSEKPLSVDRVSALGMVDDARIHGTFVAMAAKFRFCLDRPGRGRR